MTKVEYETVTVVSINDDSLSLAQLCRACRVHADYVLELVEEGIIEPSGRHSRDWRFGGLSLQRVRKARRLQRDLGVNLAGIAIILPLLEEREHKKHIGAPPQ